MSTCHVNRAECYFCFLIFVRKCAIFIYKSKETSSSITLKIRIFQMPIFSTLIPQDLRIVHVQVFGSSGMLGFCCAIGEFMLDREWETFCKTSNEAVSATVEGFVFKHSVEIHWRTQEVRAFHTRPFFDRDKPHSLLFLSPSRTRHDRSRPVFGLLHTNPPGYQLIDLVILPCRRGTVLTLLSLKVRISIVQ